MYDMPTEIDVQADGPLRIITLNRPESLNRSTTTCTTDWPSCGSG